MLKIYGSIFIVTCLVAGYTAFRFAYKRYQERQAKLKGIKESLAKSPERFTVKGVCGRRTTIEWSMPGTPILEIYHNEFTARFYIFQKEEYTFDLSRVQDFADFLDLLHY